EYDEDAALEGAVIRRSGTDVTVVTYGATLHLALEAADEMRDEGVECEIVDLRVLSPLDFETISTSIQKTSRCLIVHEDYPDYGVAAEIAARIVETLFEHLDA